MSNSALNFHIQCGEPCGSGATLEDISDWLGDYAKELEERHKRLVEAAKEVIDEEEGSTKVWRYIERLRKAVEG